MATTIEARRVSKALSSIRGPQNYAVGGKWKPELPLLTVQGVGDLYLPISIHAVRQLILIAKRAPIRHSSGHAVDQNARRVWMLGTLESISLVRTPIAFFRWISATFRLLSVIYAPFPTYRLRISSLGLKTSILANHCVLPLTPSQMVQRSALGTNLSTRASTDSLRMLRRCSVHAMLPSTPTKSSHFSFTNLETSPCV